MAEERAVAAARGALAEQAACDYLTTQGLKLQTRNYRCRSGEIDLIMRDGDTLVFVEVRYRSTMRFGGAAASIDITKQQKLIRAAQTFLGEQHLTNAPCRFDVVTVHPHDGTMRVEWIPNAIEAH
ncbi:MAG TPA: YraN family protein [Gammaproteobacteria bacterium]